MKYDSIVPNVTNLREHPHPPFPPSPLPPPGALQGVFPVLKPQSSVILGFFIPPAKGIIIIIIIINWHEVRLLRRRF